MTKKSVTRDHVTELFRRFAGQINTLTIPRPFIDLCNGDHLAALLLSQILYWSDRTDDTNGWFAKSYDEWHAELAMSEYQVKRAINGDKRAKTKVPALKDFGVETKLKPSNFHSGAATLHYRVNVSKLQDAVINFVQNAVLDNVQNAPQTLSETPPQQSSELYTETTSEPTPKTISEKNAQSAKRSYFGEIALGVFEVKETKGISEESRKRIGLLASTAKSLIAARFPTLTEDDGALLVAKFCANEKFKPAIHGKPNFELKLAAFLEKNEPYIPSYLAQQRAIAEREAQKIIEDDAGEFVDPEMVKAKMAELLAAINNKAAS
jgi:hypothetical protein